MKRLLPILAALAVLAAGCGGSSSKQSSQEQWASNLCTYVGDWKTQVTQTFNDVSKQIQSPQSGMMTTIKADLNKAVTATSDLAKNLKSLPAPQTDSGDKAKQQLDALSSQLDKTVSQSKEALNSLSPNASITQAVSKLSSLAPSLQALSTSVTDTLDSVKASGSELKQGFQDADSCKQFRSS
jgi:hypothetical protein